MKMQSLAKIVLHCAYKSVLSMGKLDFFEGLIILAQIGYFHRKSKRCAPDTKVTPTTFQALMVRTSQ